MDHKMASIIRIMTSVLASHTWCDNCPFGVAINVSGTWTMKQRASTKLRVI